MDLGPFLRSFWLPKSIKIDAEIASFSGCLFACFPGPKRCAGSAGIKGPGPPVGDVVIPLGGPSELNKFKLG